MQESPKSSQWLPQSYLRVDALGVTYEYLSTKSDKLIRRIVTGRQFVEGFEQHILPAGFRKVRYHGWMCSSSKTLDFRFNKIKCTIRAWFVNHVSTIDTSKKAWTVVGQRN